MTVQESGWRSGLALRGLQEAQTTRRQEREEYQNIKTVDSSLLRRFIRPKIKTRKSSEDCPMLTKEESHTTNAT